MRRTTRTTLQVRKYVTLYAERGVHLLILPSRGTDAMIIQLICTSLSIRQQS